METLRSLRHVIARIRKPGSARRAPVTTVVRVVATSGVLISALALVGVGAAQAATGSHTAQSVAVGHSVRAHSTGAKQCGSTGTRAARGPWLFTSNAVTTARGPWLFITTIKGPWLYAQTPQARGPWLFASPICAGGVSRG